MKNRTIKISVGTVMVLIAATMLDAQNQDRDTAKGGEEFFIISSVDKSKDQLVLKHPTEVTELMNFSNQTQCINDHGKPLECGKLRAGDTVFVTSTRKGEGPRQALRIRIGPMTVDEIHRKYVDYE